MEVNPLRNHIASSYSASRLGFVVIAFIFPPVLVFGGFIAGVEFQSSMSAYYHAGEGAMRNWFVGLLFALGLNLYLHKGYSKIENYALNLAGLFAIGVALFPTEWENFKGLKVSPLGINLSLHGFCAVALFVCIGYVCVFRASDTLSLIGDEDAQNSYSRKYKILGWLMVASPLLAFLLSAVIHLHTSAIFFIEMAGVWVFAYYWNTKRKEIARSNADSRAAHGDLYLVMDDRSSMFKSAKVLEEKHVQTERKEE